MIRRERFRIRRREIVGRRSRERVGARVGVGVGVGCCLIQKGDRRRRVVVVRGGQNAKELKEEEEDAERGWKALGRRGKDGMCNGVKSAAAAAAAAAAENSVPEVEDRVGFVIEEDVSGKGNGHNGNGAPVKETPHQEKTHVQGNGAPLSQSEKYSRDLSPDIIVSVPRDGSPEIEACHDALSRGRVRKLGQGQFGAVYLVNASIRLPGTQGGKPIIHGSAAIKVLHKSDTIAARDVDDFRREMKLMRSLHHPNILAVLGVSETTLPMMLITDYAETNLEKVRHRPCAFECPHSSPPSPYQRV